MSNGIEIVSGGLSEVEILLLLIVAFFGLVVYVWSIVWVYKDAERRGENSALIALLVALMSRPPSD